jgi:galactose mutarotase-like enzyme
MTEDMRNAVTIGAGDWHAVISPLGAELRSLRWAGRELLWTPDPAVWSGTCPILFPVIGRTCGDIIRVSGRGYPMPMHGFALTRTFEITSVAADACVLTLRDDLSTWMHFPFSFRLEMRFALAGGGLTVTARIGNPAATPLPVSFGLHPGFRWPLAPDLAVDRHRIEFPEDDALTCTRPVDRLVGPEWHRIVLTDRTLPLHEELFRPGGLLVISPRSRRLIYGVPGGLSITLDVAAFPNLLLWMRPGSPFLCIEPCLGHADPVGFAGDFTGKPGLAVVGPGRTLALPMRIGAGRAA